MEEAEPAVRRAFVALYGHQRGREATAEAFSFAWEHWPKVRTMTNPRGYLFRVGQTRTRPRRRPTALVERPQSGDSLVEPGLGPALARLSDRQRVAVVLVHGFGWTMREVADLQGIKVTTVQTHLDRGLERLRHEMEEADHG